MQKIVVATDEQLREVIEDTLTEILEERLPEVLKKVRRKEYMSSNEAMEFLGINRRQLQYLKDKKGLPFSQSGRQIFYKTSEVEAWLKDHAPERGSEFQA